MRGGASQHDPSSLIQNKRHTKCESKHETRNTKHNRQRYSPIGVRVHRSLPLTAAALHRVRKRATSRYTTLDTTAIDPHVRHPREKALLRNRRRESALATSWPSATPALIRTRHPNNDPDEEGEAKGGHPLRQRRRSGCTWNDPLPPLAPHPLP